MIYENVKEAVFKERLNRFEAVVEIDGKKEVVHVKNTGRCKELLIDGAKVVLQKMGGNRKTNYDLICVYKGDMLVNMDSQAPNKVVYEWLVEKNLINADYVKPEYKYKNSRFDFYAEGNGKKYMIEVKGVTLEENGVVLFPDAPTERGVKHIKELIECVNEGYEAYIIFVVQMEGMKYFTPNVKTHKEFADTLAYAKERGVNVVCLDCFVKENSLKVNKFVQIEL